ncbi:MULTISPECIES: hypothetical protein [Metabacillus]|nr:MULTISPECIES: hypothetical protein [Metabacillus]MDX8289027.1 hypothetical protein [Metabacillus indicus]
MSQWITPEEMERKRELKKRVVTVTIPVLTIAITALVTVLINGL